MFPNSRRSTLTNAGCFLEDLEPNASNVNSSRTDLRPETSPKPRTDSLSDSNQLLTNEGVARAERANSATSFASTLSLSGDFCKICHCGGEPNTPLITPCFCSGSLKHVHQECLQKWIKSSDIKRCELCKYPFAMQSKVKPFCQWEKLDMSSIERRKLLCSVTFHVVAITCVVWSLYILIDRTADEIKMGDLKWPFWTKLVVVAIGFTGGLVFMYIQCKVYVHLCRKWKAYNRIIVVQEAPEGLHKPSQSKTTTTTSATATTSANEQQIIKEEESSHSDFRRPSAAVPAASTGAGVSNKSNAETQTALRGVSIVPTAEMKIYREIDQDSSTSNSPSGATLPGAAAYFFADCECEGKAYAVSSSSPSLSAPSSRSGTIKSGKSGRKSGRRQRRASEATYSIAESSAGPESPNRSKGELPGSPIDSVVTHRNSVVIDVEDEDNLHPTIGHANKILPPLRKMNQS